MTQYRRAEPSDFAEAAALDGRAWEAYANAEAIPDGEHVWRLWVEHALVYVARQADELIGVILAFPCLSGAWCVHKVFVDVEHRDRGVGTRLFEMLLTETDEMRVDCFLTVGPANERALRLYQKWGFTDRRFVKGYYQPDEDRFVLTRRACPPAAG